MSRPTGPLRYTLRQFRAAPVFTATVILTLALGIGGTTAIFTLIHAVMLRSLPVSDPSRLYRVGDGDDCCVESGPQNRWGMYSFPLIERLAAETPEFESVAAFQAGGNRVSVRRAGVDAAARPLRSEYVTGNYFSTLGVPAYSGRLMKPDDDVAGAAPVVVLSHHAWQGIYGGDPSVIGSSLVVEGRPYTVAGVAPPAFFGDTLRGDPPDLWIPLHQEPAIAGASSLLQQSSSAWLRVIGRLRPGASTDGMAARLTSLLRTWMQHDSEYPANWMPDVMRTLAEQHIDVVPAGSGVGSMKEQYGRSLQILLAVCGLVLLVACANVANLLLARAVARRAQTAIRLAVGASRRQIVTQALVESVTLALAGGFAGLVVAIGAARLLLSLAFSSAKFVPISASPSPMVLGFAIGLAILTGVIFGAAPAWFLTRTDPVDALRGSGRVAGDRSSPARKVLLVVQAALSVVLIAGSTMLARSLDKLQSQDFGFAIPNRVLVALNRPPSDYTPERLTSVYRVLEDRMTNLPGVQGAGLATYNVLTDNWGEEIHVAGHDKPSVGFAGASWDRVSTNYLQNLGVTVTRGRLFSSVDNETTAPVAVVNDAFVRRFLKSDEDPIGQHFGMTSPKYAGMLRIVGVIHDAKFAPFELNFPARPMFYMPLTQTAKYDDAMMVRTDANSHFVRGLMLVTAATPGAIEPQITRLLADVDPNLTIVSVRSLQQQVSLVFDQERAVASLASLFGLVALVLAAVGLYGVTAYSVAQRTNEIGLRMALGADRVSVVGLVMRGAFQRVAVGLILGLPLAIGAGRLIASQLYGINFWDPFALGAATIALATCAFVAAIIPAGRAASISPMSALRAD